MIYDLSQGVAVRRVMSSYKRMENILNVSNLLDTVKRIEHYVMQKR